MPLIMHTFAPFRAQKLTFQKNPSKNYWIQGQRNKAGLASRRILGHRDRPGTERDPCPEMPGFVVPRDFSSGTVPQIFVPVPTVPWLWVPVPVPIMGICGTGPGSRHCPGTTAHPCWGLSFRRVSPNLISPKWPIAAWVLITGSRQKLKIRKIYHL